MLKSRHVTPSMKYFKLYIMNLTLSEHFDLIMTSCKGPRPVLVINSTRIGPYRFHIRPHMPHIDPYRPILLPTDLYSTSTGPIWVPPGRSLGPILVLTKPHIGHLQA